MSTLAQQWVEQGIEKGIEKGMEKGLAHGQQKAMRENILDLLQIRFGSYPELAATRLQTIEDLDKLRFLLRQAATAESMTTFLAALT